MDLVTWEKFEAKERIISLEAELIWLEQEQGINYILKAGYTHHPLNHRP
jgi:hypothetical protein